MVALFLALTAALALILWAELGETALRAVPRRKTKAEGALDTPVEPLETLLPRRAAAPAATPAQADEDDIVMARLAALLDEPAPLAATPAPAPVAAPLPAIPETITDNADDLPRVSGYRPGDVIELELEGPVPRLEDIRFEQAGRDTRVLIEGLPALVVQRVRAHALSPAMFRFRSPQLA